MTRVAITATGRYMPERVVPNSYFYGELGLDTNEEWIRSRTGIRERRWADLSKGESTSGMSTRAAVQCLERAGVAPEAIDAILVATVTPDMPLPATACLVQAALGAKNAFALDIAAACSGYVFALAQAVAFIKAGMAQRVLVIGAETMSAILDYQDRTTCVIFGDGAGATLVEAAPGDHGAEILDFCMHTDGTGAEPLHIPGGGSRRPASHATVDGRLHFVKQDGRTVFKNAVKGISDVILEILARNGLSTAEIDLFVPHQANLRIIESCMKKLRLPVERVVVTLDKWANTTAATIPTSLDLAVEEGRLRKGDTLVFATFGAGFTWGSTLLRW